jgi:hypothetical protein
MGRGGTGGYIAKGEGNQGYGNDRDADGAAAGGIRTDMAVRGVRTDMAVRGVRTDMAVRGVRTDMAVHARRPGPRGSGNPAFVMFRLARP